MTTPYISISESDVERAVKDELGLDRTIDLPNGGYLNTLEVIAEIGIGRPSFRESAITGVHKRLRLEAAWLKHRVEEYVEEYIKENS